VAFRRAVELKPAWLEANSDLAAVLSDLHQYDEVIAVLGRAIKHHSQCAELHASLAGALAELGRADEAIASFRQAIETKPSLAKAYRNLAVLLTHRGELDEATALLRKTIEIEPDYANAHSSLAVTLAGTGRLDGAIAEFRKAVELRPENAKFHSNLVYLFQFHPDYDPAAILAECRQWSARHEPPLASSRPDSYPNDRTPDRRLRIGYVSSDFSSHVVGRNVLPLIENHDHRQFEISCYHNSWRGDDTTRKFIAAADQWRQIDTADDAKVCEMIRADGIDILVDLSLHMRDNRLPVFARKPAPVQVTFAGYPGTTGLRAIDYRLTDPFLDPPGRGDEFYSEKSIRLPSSFWCYDPIAMSPANELPVAPLPALKNGFVTFGCLNNFRKVNERVLELWSKVLAAVASSRLILLTPVGEARKKVLEYLDPSRVEFVDRLDRPEYLQTYNRIDLGLDTFPYNGHTTSLDSLWMGAPVVTLIGRTVVGRAGWSQLSNLNLREFAADAPEKFVEIAKTFAADLTRLSQLREGLRDRMQNSPLTASVKFSRDIEAAYREMWKIWCERLK
jgi:protein O-GlcNAc transferase